MSRLLKVRETMINILLLKRETVRMKIYSALRLTGNCIVDTRTNHRNDFAYATLLLLSIISAVLAAVNLV